MVQKINRPKPWKVQWRDQSGKLKSATFRLKSEAEAFQRKVDDERNLIRRGLELPSDEILVDQYAVLWMTKRSALVERGKLAAGTLAMDEQRLNTYVLPAIGQLPMNVITSRMIRELLDDAQAERTLSDSTRNRIRAVLHTLFRDAFMDEKIAANPVARVELEKETPERVDPLTKAEIDSFIAACFDKSFSLGFCAEIMIFEGQRVSQVAGLQNRDFDVEREELHLRRIYDQFSKAIVNRIKGRPEGLSIPLFPRVRARFLEHLKSSDWKRPNDFCFHTERGEPLGVYSLKYHMTEIANRVLGRHLTPHVLRATFATLAEELGYSKEDVQRMMGHATVLVTQRYTRRAVQPLVEKGKKLGFGALAETQNVVTLKRGNE